MNHGVPITEVETARLRLEPLMPRHAAAMFDGLRDQRLYEFIEERPPESLDALQGRYERLALRRSANREEAWLNWAIWSKAHGQHIGFVQATVDAERRTRIAYVLLHDYWGLGFGREATAAMIDYLLSEWRATRLIACVDARNRRSIRLLVDLGFRGPTETHLRPGPSVEYELPLAPDGEAFPHG